MLYDIYANPGRLKQIVVTVASLENSRNGPDSNKEPSSTQ